MLATKRPTLRVRFVNVDDMAVPDQSYTVCDTQTLGRLVSIFGVNSRWDKKAGDTVLIVVPGGEGTEQALARLPMLAAAYGPLTPAVMKRAGFKPAGDNVPARRAGAKAATYEAL